MPKIANFFDQLAHSCVFDSLDIAHRYHQIRTSKEDVPKIAFRVSYLDINSKFLVLYFHRNSH